MTGIYCFRNLINQKVYIGQAVDIERRYKQHLQNINNLNHQEALYVALRKYGLDNFSFEILQQCSVEQLSELEVYYISQYNAYFDGGYNETKGGEGTFGYKHTQEIKDKMSQSRKGRVIDDVWKKHLKEGSSHHKAWNKGITMSDDFKKKLSELNKGHKHTEQSKKKMSENSGMKKAVICDGIEFVSITECAKFYGVKFSILRNWLDGTSYIPKDFYNKGLRYVDKDPNYEIIISPIKQVICDNINYNNISECASFYSVDRKLMSKWLHGILPMPQDFLEKGLRFEDKIYYKSNPKN